MLLGIGRRSARVAAARAGGFRHPLASPPLGRAHRVGGPVSGCRPAGGDQPGEDDGHGLDDLDLSRLLTDQLLLEEQFLVSRLTPLLEPGELQQVALAEPLEQLRGLAALLERGKASKRCRHLLEAWDGQRLQTLEGCIAVLISERQDAHQPVDMETRIQTLFDDLNRDALRYQELYYTERKHIQHLDQQRRGGFRSPPTSVFNRLDTFASDPPSRPVVPRHGRLV